MSAPECRAAGDLEGEAVWSVLGHLSAQLADDLGSFSVVRPHSHRRDDHSGLAVLAHCGLGRAFGRDLGAEVAQRAQILRAERAAPVTGCDDQHGLLIGVRELGEQFVDARRFRVRGSLHVPARGLRPAKQAEEPDEDCKGHAERNPGPAARGEPIGKAGGSAGVCHTSTSPAARIRSIARVGESGSSKWVMRARDLLCRCGSGWLHPEHAHKTARRS